MKVYPYRLAPEEYFTRFRRTSKGFQGMKQRFLPQSVVLTKGRYFALAQSIYLTNILASAGLLKAGREGIDVAVIGSGLPFLGEQLYSNGITAVSVDPNENLAGFVEKEFKLHNSFIIGEPASLPLADLSVSVAASHNLLQKLPGPNEAKRAVREMLRVAKNYAIIQVTPKEHPYFKGDDAHILPLSEREWSELILGAVNGYANGWNLREVHKVLFAHSIPAGRPPVFVLEKGTHNPQKREYEGLAKFTKATWRVQDEATPANAISIARPVAAYFGIHELDGIALSAFLGLTMATDAFDGMVARKIGPSPWGHHVDRMSDHATECIALFGLGFPLIPYVFLPRDIVVDSMYVAGLVDESKTNRKSLISRGGYGVLKVAAFMTVPVLPEAGHVLGYAATMISIERGVEVLKHARWKR